MLKMKTTQQCTSNTEHKSVSFWLDIVEIKGDEGKIAANWVATKTTRKPLCTFSGCGVARLGMAQHAVVQCIAVVRGLLWLVSLTPTGKNLQTGSSANTLTRRQTLKDLETDQTR